MRFCGIELELLLVQATIMTNTKKFKPVGINGVTGLPGKGGVEVNALAFLYVMDAAALLAQKVIMVIGPAVEAAEGVSKVQLEDIAGFVENAKVPVNGAEADAWYVLLYLLEDPVGGWMRLGMLQNPQDLFPLAGFPEARWLVLQRFHF